MHNRNTVYKFGALSVVIHLAAALVYTSMPTTSKHSIRVSAAQRPLQISIQLNNDIKLHQKTIQRLPSSESNRQKHQPEEPTTISRKSKIEVSRKNVQQATAAQPANNSTVPTIKTVSTPQFWQLHDTDSLRNRSVMKLSSVDPAKSLSTLATHQASPVSLKKDLKSAIHSRFTADPAPTQRTPDTNAVRKKLAAYFDEHFYYPSLAVNRGWQGTVKLGLRIESNGKLSQVRIIKTSGYAVLDKAALATLKKVTYINDIEDWLAGSYFDTVLPVKYQLIGG